MGSLYTMVAYFMHRLMKIAASDMSTVCLKVDCSICCIKTQKSIRNLWSQTKNF